MKLNVNCILLLLMITAVTQADADDIETNLIHGQAGSYSYNGKSPAAPIHDEIDIFQLINVSAKDQGVSLVDGPILGYPAYKFRLPYGNVPLHNSSTITHAIRNNANGGFTMVFLYKQQRYNLGTLVSINSPGRLTPWFQIVSNMKTNTINVKYKLKANGKLRQIEWYLGNVHNKKSPLASWIWMSITVDFNTGTLRLDLDCLPSKFESLTQGKQRITLDIPKDSLVYFRQEPGRKKKFLGSMQVAKVLPFTMQDRLWSCTEITNEPKHRKPIQ